MSEKATEQTPTIEETFAQIEAIIEQLEQPEVTLDQSFRLYQQGVGQLKVCTALLDEVEKQMLVINAEGDLEKV